MSRSERTRAVEFGGLNVSGTEAVFGFSRKGICSEVDAIALLAKQDSGRRSDRKEKCIADVAARCVVEVRCKLEDDDLVTKNGKH